MIQVAGEKMIEDYSFGTMAIDVVSYTKDLKIRGGKVVADWWRDNDHRVTERSTRLSMARCWFSARMSSMSGTDKCDGGKRFGELQH